jgi:adenylosuccinate synthase
MPVTVIVGEQRGDEGKGRIVDMLAAKSDMVARFNGGPNAGHTVVLPDERILKLHVIPSGIAYSHTVNIIGNGTFVDPIKLDKEIEDVRAQGIKVSPENLKLSAAAHLLLPIHVSDDEIREAGKGGQGSTKSGIAQVAADKYLRSGIRAEALRGNLTSLRQTIEASLIANNKNRTQVGLELIDAAAVAKEFASSAKKLRDYVTDTVTYVNEQLTAGKTLLAEGAQAFLLDIDHGMYPYTTSSSTTVGGVLTGLGIGPKHIDKVIGVAKATQSHVGGGPFVTEVTDEKQLAALRGEVGKIDTEQGTTTGRWRRMGYFDLPLLRRAQMINGSEAMTLTKLDCVPRYGEEVKICVAYNHKGKTIKIAPGSAAELEAAQPVYETLPTWEEDIQAIRKFEDLPQEAQVYIKFIEGQTGVPITHIGVGPGRDQVITR